MGRRIKQKAKELIKEYPGIIYLDVKECFEALKEKEHLVLEIGMGSGNFISQIGLDFPEKTFLGLEVKEERCVKAGKKIKNNELNNAFVVSTPFDDFVEYLEQFENLKEIWITFPDPWPKAKHIKNRFINDRNINFWIDLIKKKNLKFFFKTDNDNLFSYTQYLFREEGIEFAFSTVDLHNSDFPVKIISEFEAIYLRENKNINLFEINNI